LGFDAIGGEFEPPIEPPRNRPPVPDVRPSDTGGGHAKELLQRPDDFQERCGM
jgi:hypothetical protein